MPVVKTTVQPNQDVAAGFATFGPGSSHFDRLNEGVPGSDAEGISASGPGVIDTLGFEDLPLPSGTIIHEVRFRINFAGTIGGGIVPNVNVELDVGGAQGNQTMIIPPVFLRQTNTITFSGLHFTAAQMKALQIRLTTAGSWSASSVSIYSVEAQVFHNALDTITLNDPIIRVDGVRTPYFCASNNFFKRLKANLRDDNIYDTSEAAVPFTNRIVTFEGTTISNQNLKAFNEVQGQKRFISDIPSNASGTFEISVLIRNGRNKITVETADGAVVSNAVFLNAYRLHAWLCTYAEELNDVRNQTAQTRQDSKLRDANDFDGVAIANTGRGLTESFGQFIGPLVRIPGLSVANWRQGIRDTLESYKVAPSVRSMTLATRFFTGQDPEYRFFKDENRIRRPIFVDGDNFFLASAANPGVDTSVSWKQRRAYFYNRWWTTQASSVTLATGATSYIYFDGTSVASNRFLAQPIIALSAPPVTGTRSVMETIASANIQIDTNGSKTGLSGELFIRTTFPVSGEPSAIVHSISPFTLPDAKHVPGTSFIDIGHAQLGMDKRPNLGNIFLTYSTPLQIFEVAQITTNATGFTKILTGLRFDEVSGAIRETQVAQNAGELIVHNSQTLTSGVRNLLSGVLAETKPPRSFFHVFMQDPTTGEMRFHAKV